MKKFQVTVNGNAYEVEVEEIGGSFSPSAAPASAPTAAPAAPKAVPAAVPANAVKVGAPMPGKIVGVKVAVGQTINEGDLVAVLEAMKMENEIFASKSGTIASVNVTTGAMVETNDVIVTIN
ncbi:biotin/lipoyl-containing protein [Cellulosilyticum sp. I15G10I2]|uniref:biotin/lipoyl-containing protein n=1 Tax=Cellulosilyticum sp. I15G10I2 TaxID=1892843 RepID=UPI00085C7187|nr:biotin/lipoyl-containing protein [Cellulosilyticum sp. I15G10I2]